MEGRRRLSDAHKRALSRAQMGHPVSQETRRKQARTMRAFYAKKRRLEAEATSAKVRAAREAND